MTALNQGINRYYRKDGGQQAMIRDFRVVQPSDVHINKVCNIHACPLKGVNKT